MYIRQLLLASTVLLTPVLVNAMTLEEAITTFNNEDYATSLPVLEKLANSGVPRAQNAIGLAYLEGLGPYSVDIDKAFEQFTAAKANGSMRAAYSLGFYWLDGVGPDGVDIEKSLKEFADSHNMGFKFAASEIGYHYRWRKNPSDFELAATWFRRSAEKDDDYAMIQLAEMLDLGMGVEQNTDEARALYQSALDLGNSNGAIGLALISATENDFGTAMEYVEQRLGDLSRTDPETGYFDIGENVADRVYLRDAEGQLAYHIFKRGAEAGEIKSLIAQADLLDIGTLVERDKSKAVELYERAIAMDDSGRANHFYADHFMSDKTVEDRYAKALAQYEASIAKGYNVDLINIGHMYFYGYGVEQDYAKSLEYTQRGLEFVERSGYNESSTAFAYSNMGEYYFWGLGVEQDYAQSLAYYTKADELGSDVAYYFLGEHSRQGLEIEQDFERAFEYFKVGAEAEDPEATFALGRAYELGEGVSADPLIARAFYFKAMEAGAYRGAERLMAMAENGAIWRWTSAEDAYRYCLAMVALDKRPHSTASQAECNEYKTRLPAPTSDKIAKEVAQTY